MTCILYAFIVITSSRTDFKSDKIIRILLLKIVNSSMENINKTLENNGDGQCKFPMDIIISNYSIYKQNFQGYYFVLSTCIFSLFLYFCEHH